MKAESKVLKSLLLAALVLLVVGCAKAPEEPMNAARAALSEAEGAEAAAYASAELATARDALAAAQAEIEAQNGKFALFRTYTKAEELIAEASTRAQEAQEAAVAGKAAAREAAESAVQEAQDRVAQAQTLIVELEACPRKPKGFAADMSVLKGQVDGLAASLSTLTEALAAERFQDAEARSQSLVEQADTLIQDLEGARTKLGC
jgi:hypothetical protein